MTSPSPDRLEQGSPIFTPWRRGRRAMRVIGPVMGIVWVVFLVQPLRAAWDSGPGAARWVSVVAVVALALSFAFVVVRYARPYADGMSRDRAVAFLVGQVVLVGLSTIAADQVGLVGLVFVCVSGVFLLRGPAVLGVAVLASLAIVVVPRVAGWDPIDDLVVSVVLSTVAMFGFTQLVRRNRQLQLAQDEVAVLAVERERERIARDMHDILGHSLTVISVKAELAARLLDRDPERARGEVLEVQQLARSALADVRGMVTATRAVTLAGELAGARLALDSAGVQATLPGSVEEVPEDLRELFAWGLREGTTNVLRHAGARRVVVVMDARTLIVDDDGAGPPDAAAAQDSHGLLGLTERARRAGARVEVGASPIGGYRLLVTRDGGAPGPAGTPDGRTDA
ncbi:histidine kinase [Cellulomonas sp. DKR-3]|uniref:Histidine kinase n=1 Tax=Cellulomonas fulva TaxID=2835530 RepID=A0ABS5U0A8_9CELL|nr:histidine kinase [Cellulomonas fulva]MBT0994767.1 histidine kinase [Cellulomonas fulva]